MASIRPWTVAVVMVMCIGFVARITAEEPTTKPSSESRDEKVEKKAARSGGRLFAPWSKLSSLTDDQRAKIREIHARTQAERRALEAKEESEIRALLNDDQKKELRELEDKTAADRKAKSGKGGSKGSDDSDREENDKKD